MSSVLLILLLAILLVGAWFVWPSLTAERDQARRLRQIDQARRRALTDMDYLAQRAWRERSLADTQRIDRIVDEHDL
ncbi:MAG: hypothetical protein DLM57_08065 [Pseudonocardiales bacterium]|nr:MAG: hypothetical protein DLM57_08065 [Pseudonocardiales bacterium]